MTRNYWQSICKAATVLGAVMLLGGCDAALLDPKGPIGLAQRNMIITAFVVMLLVVIPVIFMTFWFAWKYRATNKEATYAPNWAHSNKLEAVVWGVPIIIIVVLSIITWHYTHVLSPQRPIESDRKPVNVEVVSLDWKWLFIYPDLGIASVNELALPVGTPVKFSLTSATAMNSFFIPQLGSQLYAMGGMSNKLWLQADEPGVYRGTGANFTGNGFSGMQFNAYGKSPEDFQAWVDKVKESHENLDMNRYNQLAEPSMHQPVEYFSAVQPNLYQSILEKTRGEGLGVKTVGAGE